MSFAKTLVVIALGAAIAVPVLAQNNDVGKDKGGVGDKKGALMMDKGGADKKGQLMMDKGGDKGGKKGAMDARQLEAAKQGAGVSR